MQGSNTPALATSDEAPTQTICSLEPLRSEGRDSLTPDGTDDVLDAKLGQLDLLWDNATHETTTEIADDLFRDSGPLDKTNNPIPDGAEPYHATLKFLLKGSSEPHAIDLTPPSTIKYQHPQDAGRLRTFLTHHHFITPQKLSHLLVLCLALLGAMVPDLDDDDDNDPGDDTDRCHCPA